ncbi:hypothetical protein HDU86_000530 [Geranomyces michiganensis]|nr:hypothetical protein HDU86_000530 [Geranomyces michiganensis]
MLLYSLVLAFVLLSGFAPTADAYAERPAKAPHEALLPFDQLKRKYVDPGLADTSISYSPSAPTIDLDAVVHNGAARLSCAGLDDAIHLTVKNDASLTARWQPGMFIAATTNAGGLHSEDCRRIMRRDFAEVQNASGGKISAYDTTAFRKITAVEKRTDTESAAATYVFMTEPLAEEDHVLGSLDLKVYIGAKNAEDHFAEHSALTRRTDDKFRLSDIIDLSYNYDRANNEAKDVIDLFEFSADDAEDLTGDDDDASSVSGSGDDDGISASGSVAAKITCTDCYY